MVTAREVEILGQASKVERGMSGDARGHIFGPAKAALASTNCELCHSVIN